jgi:hypothetical protein
VTPLYPRNVGTNLPTGGGRSVGIVRLDCGHGIPWPAGVIIMHCLCVNVYCHRVTTQLQLNKYII